MTRRGVGGSNDQNWDMGAAMQANTAGAKQRAGNSSAPAKQGGGYWGKGQVINGTAATMQTRTSKGRHPVGQAGRTTTPPRADPAFYRQGRKAAADWLQNCMAPPSRSHPSSPQSAVQRPNANPLPENQTALLPRAPSLSFPSPSPPPLPPPPPPPTPAAPRPRAQAWPPQPQPPRPAAPLGTGPP